VSGREAQYCDKRVRTISGVQMSVVYLSVCLSVHTVFTKFSVDAVAAALLFSGSVVTHCVIPVYG